MCEHNFNGPYTRYLKIGKIPAYAANLEDLNINFRPSLYIFAGIGESFSKLKVLAIAMQNIKYVEREDFAGLKFLERLRLDQNEITFLPEDVFAELPNLWWLDISWNKIKHFPAKIFVKLTNIEWIWTYGNPATTNDIDFGIREVNLYNETKYHEKTSRAFSKYHDFA